MTVPHHNERADIGGNTDPSEVDTQDLNTRSDAHRAVHNAFREVTDFARGKGDWEAVALAADEGLFLLNKCTPEEMEKLAFPYRAFFAFTILRGAVFKAELLFRQGMNSPQRREYLHRAAWTELSPYASLIEQCTGEGLDDRQLLTLAKMKSAVARIRDASKGTLDVIAWENEDD